MKIKQLFFMQLTFKILVNPKLVKFWCFLDCVIEPQHLSKVAISICVDANRLVISFKKMCNLTCLFLLDTELHIMLKVEILQKHAYINRFWTN